LSDYLKSISILDFNTDCWLCQKGQATTEINSHCRIMYEGQRELVHRWSAYIYFDFNLDSELFICHKQICFNRNCWNPEHLYIGTQSDNVKDTVELKTHKEVKKTHCSLGHLLDGLRGNGKRYCLTCNRLRSANRYHLNNLKK